MFGYGPSVSADTGGVLASRDTCHHSMPMFDHFPIHATEYDSELGVRVGNRAPLLRVPASPELVIPASWQGCLRMTRVWQCAAIRGYARQCVTMRGYMRAHA